MRKFILFMVGSLIISLSHFASAEPRVFTDKTGRKITGEIVGIHGDRIELKVLEKKFIFPIESLSSDDQDFVKEWSRSTRSFKMDFQIKAVEDPAQRKDIAKDRIFSSTQKMSGKSTSWKYDATVANLSGSDLENITVKFNIFIRNTLTKGTEKAENCSVVFGKQDIPTLLNTKRSLISTDWLEMQKKEWQESRVSMGRDSLGRSSSSTYFIDCTSSTELDGMWIKLFLGDREISDWKSEGKMIKEAVWSDESVKTRMPLSTEKGAEAPNIPTPTRVYQAHEDLNPIPPVPEDLKKDSETVDKWTQAVIAAQEAANAIEKRRTYNERKKLIQIYEKARSAYLAKIQK